MISTLSAAMILLATSVVPATDGMPKPGAYGFNWLDPHSHCRQITQKDLAQVSKCSVNTNAFGLSSRSHTCKVNAHIELVIYETAAQCKEALETMQANGD